MAVGILLGGLCIGTEPKRLAFYSSSTKKPGKRKSRCSSSAGCVCAAARPDCQSIGEQNMDKHCLECRFLVADGVTEPSEDRALQDAITAAIATRSTPIYVRLVRGICGWFDGFSLAVG
jgi:hypothetical protein